MREEILEKAIHGLEKNFPQYSLRLFLKKYQKLLRFIFICLITSVFLFPKILAFFLFLFLNFSYFSVQIFKVILTVIGYFNHEGKLPTIEPTSIYSILLPVYREAKVIQKLIQAVDKIDYPKELLDVKIIVEEDDHKIISTLKTINLPKHFEIIKVPVSSPRTKPKACNYALQFAKGKFVVVYDAEDRPDPMQLKLVIAKFANSPPDVVCIQARLNFYNAQENYLTRLFATEYSILFDYILRGLKKLDIPIPLGGTSNHFIKDKLIELGGWDAFNVTEDADLGIRLYDQKYRIELINSITLEESPLSLKAWIIQRARWIKGHILTSMLHLKKHRKNVWGLYLFLYFPNLIYLLLPIYLLLWLIVAEQDLFDIFWQINLILGIILPLCYSIFVCIIKKWKFKILDCLLTIPYYWLLPIAGLRASWQIFRKPFHWDKTKHGVSKNYEK